MVRPLSNPLALLQWVAERLTEVPTPNALPQLDLGVFTEPELFELARHARSHEEVHASWRDALHLLAALQTTDYVPEVVQTNSGLRVAAHWAGPVGADWLLARAAEHLAAYHALRKAEMEAAS